MDDEAGDEDVPLFDVESVYRMVALACATFADTSKDHEVILAKAMAFEEYIDPLGFRYEGEADADDGTLKVSFQSARRPG